MRICVRSPDYFGNMFSKDLSSPFDDNERGNHIYEYIKQNIKHLTHPDNNFNIDFIMKNNDALYVSTANIYGPKFTHVCTVNFICKYSDDSELFIHDITDFEIHHDKDQLYKNISDELIKHAMVMTSESFLLASIYKNVYTITVYDCEKIVGTNTKSARKV